ncbi:DNA alkylation repair protein [Amphibacillus sp. Q70]|uniref:DNA alkylation repair protein n=1 Tax=Amphibacillus sp. Q70 TaxID=3453416 RepID=UPI003F83C1E1
MNCEEIIAELRSHASEKYQANVVSMGIPKAFSIGVPTTTVRKMAKKINKSNALAWQLWETKYHGAKLLAVLLFDINQLSDEDIEFLMSEVISWDLCDHICKNLLIKRADYNKFIRKWMDSSKIYYKRAAFTLMASAVIHDKGITDNRIDDYLQLINEYSETEHNHVKKAVAWALREIGKIDFTYNEKALLLAYHLKESGSKAQVWIAKNVIKELEKMVKVDERRRLLSADSKMGKQSGRGSFFK